VRDVSLWRALFGVEKTVIELVEFDEDAELLVAHVRPTSRARSRCGNLLKTDDNPDGGLEESGLQEMEEGARTDRANFLDGFTTAVFTAGDKLKVTEEQRQQAIALQQPAREEAVVGRIGAFGRTDFREDLPRSTSRPCPVELRRYSASIVHLTTPSAFVPRLPTPLGFVSGRGPGTTTRAIRRVGFKA